MSAFNTSWSRFKNFTSEFHYGTNDNNTSFKMLLAHCYAFGLALKASGPKKNFINEGVHWIRLLAHMAVQTTLVLNREYFIPTKVHQNLPTAS